MYFYNWSSIWVLILTMCLHCEERSLIQPFYEEAVTDMFKSKREEDPCFLVGTKSSGSTGSPHIEWPQWFFTVSVTMAVPNLWKVKTIESVLKSNCLEEKQLHPAGRSMVISNVFDKGFNASTIAILCKMCLKISDCTSCNILSSVLCIY